MKSILSFPGNMLHAQHIALALAEHGWLDRFVTTVAYNRDGAAEKLLRAMPVVGARLDRQLARRGMPAVPGDLIKGYPAWEVARTVAQKAGMSAPVVDRIWDMGSQSFDQTVARRHVPHASAIHAFEYTALKSFQRAQDHGAARILHLPSLANTEYAELQRREREQWPELRTDNDAYFDRLFPARQARRDAEIAAADLLVCNSSLTARSHIAAGADPSRVLVVPLGAPPPIAEVRSDGDASSRPLRIVWAGAFSLRKGAHYMLEGWRRLAAGRNAQLDVFGHQDLPARIWDSTTERVTFHGSVSQSELFNAFEQADVLAFPTLSDGFGLVVTEALARGLPVITTDQAGAADLITKDNGLVIPAADSAAIADALQWALDNRQALQAMRHAALETARQRQWSHFRADLMTELGAGLSKRGYSTSPPSQAGL